MKAWPSVLLAAASLSVGTAVAVQTFADPPAKAGNISEARVLAEAPKGTNWLVNGGNFEEQHFSPLKSITDQNVSNLGLAWSLELFSPQGLSVEPIVVDGVAYVSAPQSKVYAVDAATGKLLWQADPHVRLSVMRNSWAARTNRGVAVWGGRVFVGTGDCRMVAFDATTGKQLWDSPVCDASQTGITGAPHVGNGKVFIGYNGSDISARGSVVAFDVVTGKEAWKFWTVPGDPAKPFESKALEMASKTWEGDEAWKVGGGDVWDPITYDPVTGYVLFGTAGASSGGSLHGDLAGIPAGGDKLFASSIVAVKAASGEYVWHYQTGRTENMHILLADLMVNGAKRRVAMTVPKTGIFYTLDVRTGQPVMGAKRINGQDAPAPQAAPPAGGRGPAAGAGRGAATADGRGAAAAGRGGAGGPGGPGHNWWPMAYNAQTGLVYIPAHDNRTGEVPPGLNRGIGKLVAWDPIKQTPRWTVEQPLSTNGGVLTTAGNLVFQGEATGEFAAYAADTGKKLWSVKTGSAIQSVPVSYSVNGEQYILMPVGMGSGSRLFARVSEMGTPESKLGPSRLYAFKLGAKMTMPPTNVTVPAVPRPPEQAANAETIQKGQAVFDKFFCHDCHSPQADGMGAWVLEGAIPDLRYMPLSVHRQWDDIVLRGSHREQGMPGFGTPAGFPMFKSVMTQADADALHAYMIDLQWKAYNADQAKAKK